MIVFMNIFFLHTGITKVRVWGQKDFIANPRLRLYLYGSTSALTATLIKSVSAQSQIHMW